MKTEDYLRELSFILFAQKRVILLTTFLVLLLSLLIAFYWPPTYSAGGSILVRGKPIPKIPQALETVELRPPLVTKEDLASEVEIFVSSEVIERTIKALQEKGISSKLDTNDTYKEVYKARSNITTELAPASNVINVTYLSKNPAEAVQILDTWMSVYLEYHSEIYNPEQAFSFFADQASKFKKGLESKENELVAAVGKTRVADPQKEIEKNVAVKQELEKQLNALRNDAISKGIYIDSLSKILAQENTHTFSFIENSAISSLSGKLQDLMIERGSLLRVYGESVDKVIQINKQIDHTYSLLKTEVKAYRDNLTVQLKVINDEIKNIQDTLGNIAKSDLELQKQLVDTQRIMFETRLLQNSYETFFKRREESDSIQMVGAPSLVSVMGKAFPSDGPVFPRKQVVIPMGLLIGFITGCTLGFMREFFDHTFKRPIDVQNYADLPIILSIPEQRTYKF